VYVPGSANRWLSRAARFLPRSYVLGRVKRIQDERRRQTMMARGGSGEGRATTVTPE
jgi:hypothetical protein